ncbi:hypothetical protein C8R45DRAFT_962442 [Mycena sanguinolenta]|nr:hypothetical protein C8R45DRAFT_962442 [Mycena sanguinolenta]
MNTLVSNAVHKFISALLYPRFPSISELSWETTLACTERDLNAKRSHGLLALYSCLEKSLVRVTKMTQVPPDLGPLREVIFSDDVLERIVLKSGVCDSCGGPESEQVGRAFLVFVDMVVMDRGIEDFASWFSDIFDPMIIAAFEACVGCQPESAGTSPTKRRAPVCEGTTSKRRRTSLEISAPSPLISTLFVLQRQRQRQMLSTSDDFITEIPIVLEIPTDQDLDGDLAEQIAQRECSSPATSASTLPSSPLFVSSTPCPPPKSNTTLVTPAQDYNGRLYQNSPTSRSSMINSTARPRLIAAMPPYDTAAPSPLLPFALSDPNTTCMSRHASALSAPSFATTHPIPVYVTPDDSLQSPVISTASSPRGTQTRTICGPPDDSKRSSTIFTSPDLQTLPSSIPSDVGVMDVFNTQASTNSTPSLFRARVALESQNLDREMAAIAFILETIDMVKRGELLPTPSVSAATFTSTSTTSTTRHAAAEAEAMHSAVGGKRKTEVRPSREEVLRTLLAAARSSVVDERAQSAPRKVGRDNSKKPGPNTQNDNPNKPNAGKSKSGAGVEVAAADTNKSRKRKPLRRRRPLTGDQLANIPQPPDDILPPSFDKFPASLYVIVWNCACFFGC